jgi:predicted DNA-binding antitoxin AbrB/MazE fold protein
MEYADEIPVVFENGVFRPESPVNLPEHTRFRILVRNGNGAADQRPNAESSSADFSRLRAKGLVKSSGWHPTRDELHERD